MEQRNLIVLGINADIGSQIAERYISEGFKVVGTYRNENNNVERLRAQGSIKLFQCDITKTESVKAFSTYIRIRV